MLEIGELIGCPGVCGHSEIRSCVGGIVDSFSRYVRRNVR